MKWIRNLILAALAAVPVASAAPSIGPSHFVNHASPETFLSDALRAAAPIAPAEPPSNTVLAACGVLGILIVKASRE